MRQEVQHWDAIRATLEIVDVGVGQTGETPTVAIQRLSDGQWLQNGGGSWDVGYATNNLSEVDAVNFPGLYEYEIPLARLNYAQGLAGYYMKFECAPQFLLEYALIHAAKSEWDETVVDHVTSETFGHRAAVALGIGGQFWHRIKSPLYNIDGQLLTCRLAAYPTSADADADINEIGHVDVTMTYDVDGNLATLKAV